MLCGWEVLVLVLEIDGAEDGEVEEEVLVVV